MFSSYSSFYCDQESLCEEEGTIIPKNCKHHQRHGHAKNAKNCALMISDFPGEYDIVLSTQQLTQRAKTFINVLSTILYCCVCVLLTYVKRLRFSAHCAFFILCTYDCYGMTMVLQVLPTSNM